MPDITCKNCKYRRSRMFAKGTYNQCVLHKCKILGETIGRLNEHLKGCPLAIKDEALDEIKAEMKQLVSGFDYEDSASSVLEMFLEVIDRHKEGKNGNN